MNLDQIVAARMRAQHLWGPPLESPAAVVRWLVAMQAQELPVARWSVAQRAGDAGAGEIDRAFASGAILRTHLLRPTWHFVLPADARWLLQLSAPRVNALNAYSYRAYELDDALMARTNNLLAAAVAGGRHRTRRELAAVLERAGITASGLRLGYILMRAEVDAVLCSGAPRGKQQTYAAFDERVPPLPPVDPDTALAELTRRYFAGRGPATLKDYVRWSSLTVAGARRGLEMVAAQLQREEIGGRTYWLAPGTPPAPVAPGPSPVVDLVQGYDEVVMAYSESRDLLHLPGMTDGTQPGATLVGGARLTHAILLNARLIGHWRQVVTGRSVTVETEVYRPLEAAEAQALEGAAGRYGRFLGLPARVSRVG